MNNNKGAATILIVFVVGIIIFMLVTSIQSRSVNLFKIRSRNRAALDVYNAIEPLGVQLKRGYDIANDAPDSNGVQPFPPTKSSADIVAGETIKFYLPEADDGALSIDSGIKNLENELCIHRADMFDFNSDVRPICVKIPEDLFTKNLNYEIKINLPMMTDSFFQIAGNSKIHISDLLIPSAHAKSDIYEPEILSTYPGIVQVNNADKTGIAKQYFGDLNCQVANAGGLEYFCLNLKICAKFDGTCADSEFIKQSFVIYKNPGKIF